MADIALATLRLMPMGDRLIIDGPQENTWRPRLLSQGKPDLPPQRRVSHETPTCPWLDCLCVRGRSAPAPHRNPGRGSLLVNEHFDYPDGNLVPGNGGWYAYDAGGLKPVEVVGHQARSQSTAGNAEDCGLPFTPRASNAKTFFGFDLVVPSLDPSGLPAEVSQPINTVVGLRQTDGDTLRAFVGIGVPDGGAQNPAGNYSIQLYPGQGAGFSLYCPACANLDFDVRYRVVAAYDAATGTHEMWLHKVNESDEHLEFTSGATAFNEVDEITIRQRTVLGGTHCYHIIDNLEVADSFDDANLLHPPVEADALQTPETGTSIDFASAPIPADFFGPGSDPFDGIISFSGDPIDPETLGNTSVRVLRVTDPFEPSDPPSPYPTQVDIELVALSLQSVNPITVNVGTSPTHWDVHLDLGGTQPTGEMLVTKTHANGGVFDMSLPVQPVYTFTNVDNPGDVRVLPAADPIVIEYLDAPWVHVVDPSLGVYVPPGATFVPGVEEIVVPGPSTSQRPVSLLTQQIVTVTGTSVPTPGVPNMVHTFGAPLAPVAPGADLVVEKTVDLPTPHEGETITYTVTLTNNGPSDATGVEVTDLLPAGVTFDLAIPSIGAYDDGTGVWTVGSLAVGSATLSFSASVDVGNVGATITNTASVTAADQTDTVLGNESGSADITVLAGVGVDGEPLPAAVALEPGRPNPFGRATTMRFGLPAAGHARLAVYDVSGGRVTTLANGAFPAGWHTRVWDGLDASGRRVAPGVYFVRLQVGRITETGRLVRMD